MITSNWRRWPIGGVIHLLALTTLVVVCEPAARADFIGGYSYVAFTTTASYVDGTACLDAGCGGAITPDGGLTLQLTGPSDGSGNMGYFDFTATALGAGLVHFHYDYSSPDWAYWDCGGYILGSPSNSAASDCSVGYNSGPGSYQILSEQSGDSGDFSFSVSAGDTFGFFVWTQDNGGGGGVLTISGFSAPQDAPSAPEPSTAGMLIAAVILIGAAKRRLSRRAS